MDLREYYKTIRKVEESISEPFPIIVSLETENGGKAGVMTEVTRSLAAKMVVDRRARLATQEEAEQFRAAIQKQRAEAELQRMKEKVQLMMIPEEDLRALRGAAKAKKSE